MVITRVQALAIALGLALVGVAAARGDFRVFHPDGQIRDRFETTIPAVLGIQRDVARTSLTAEPRL